MLTLPLISMYIAPGDIRVHLCHNNSNHQSFYSAHVLPHLSHERNPHCLHDSWGGIDRVGNGYYPRERLPMHSHCASLGHPYSRHLYQPQSLVHRKRSTQHYHRYSHSVSPGASGVGATRKYHAPTVRHWNFSVG